MADLVTDAWLAELYSRMSSAHLKRFAVHLALGRAPAYVQGPDVEYYVHRRLAIISRELESRGETFSTEGTLF